MRASSFMKLAVILSFPVFVLGAWFIPFDRLPSVCGFRLLTGYPCPFCGTTRSVAALAHMDLRQALTLSPMAVPSVAVFGLWWVNGIYEAVTNRRTRLSNWASRRAAVLWAAGLAAFLLFGVLRMLVQKLS